MGDEDAEVRRELSSSLSILSTIPSMYHMNQRLDSASMATSTVSLARFVSGKEQILDVQPKLQGARFRFPSDTAQGDSTSSTNTKAAATKQRPPIETRPPTAIRYVLRKSSFRQVWCLCSFFSDSMALSCLIPMYLCLISIFFVATLGTSADDVSLRLKM